MLLPSILKSVFTICVAAAFLLTTVESYGCTQCSKDQCSTMPSKTCHTSQACFSRKEELKASGQVIRGPYQEKGCSPGVCTPLAFSATMGNKTTFSYNYQCCHSEQCNKKDVPMPVDSKVNGVVCPACYNETGLGCDPVFLHCTGKETKCAEVVGVVRINDINIFGLFALGCATESACNLHLNILGNIEIRTKCKGTSSGSSPLKSVSSATLASLFLLKVLL
ncbi:protein RoBo-1-like [Cavia porcellus]|uniref:UPAR/Ly6 domain-containing protein n=1 Tax=Cavia porcellus TaxID=10141 RepID=A0A286Y199_CAVPO|nr:protein RoBo-1-like [Cavia porcellus]